MSGLRRAAYAGVMAVVLLGLVAPALAHGTPAASGGTSGPITGSISGPAYLPETGNGTYLINASGGPAVVDGQLVGQINYTATISGPYIQGVSIAPANGSIKTLGVPGTTVLTVSNYSETLTLLVHVVSTLGHVNASSNLTYSIQVRAPYIVRAVLTAGATGVQPFTLVVNLDGARVGNVTVPVLIAYQAYEVVFRYAVASMSSGYHTFTLSVAAEHGLVAFQGGATSFSSTFYVAAPTPNYSVWYVAGAVAFFGALFIFVTRVAARRRSPGRR